MQLLFAILIGSLFAGAFYLLQKRHMVRLVIGLIMLGNAANLLLFTAGRVFEERAPLIPPDQEVLHEPFANPLPQALILTAIVISFGLLAFSLVLVYRTHVATGEIDADALRDAEPHEELPADVRDGVLDA
jgi:multicomponent Na+:H+ antiporter subunit C